MHNVTTATRVVFFSPFSPERIVLFRGSPRIALFHFSFVLARSHEAFVNLEKEDIRDFYRFLLFFIRIRQSIEE